MPDVQWVPVVFPSSLHFSDKTYSTFTETSGAPIYNLTIIRPFNFLHASVFNEVRESVAWALAELGHVANCSENHIVADPSVTNIIFGAEYLAEEQEFPPNTIVYNLEQPVHFNWAKILRLVKKNGLTLWNCFKTPESIHVPVGYTPNLTRIPDNTVGSDIDVLFYGSLTARRIYCLAKLREAGLRVYVSTGMYGGGRDALISKAKVVLNVHHDDRNLFEIVRVSYLMANSKCVVSEISKDDDDYKELHPGFLRVPYDEITRACQETLRYSTTENMLALACIKQRDMVAYVSNALEGVLCPTTS